MPNNGEREARIGRSLKRLDHRLVRRPGGGFAIADQSGKIIAGETIFAKTGVCHVLTFSASSGSVITLSSI